MFDQQLLSLCGSTCNRLSRAVPEIDLFVGCLTPQKHDSVSQGRTCSGKFTCCHTEIEVADHTFYLTHSQYPDTGPTSTSADPATPGRVAITVPVSFFVVVESLSLSLGSDVVGWLVAQRPSNMLASLRDGSAGRIARAATLR